jgi:GWxTD domain-containing protein
MKRSLALLTILLLAAPVFARMSKYKDWSQSPEGYFMTKAERAQWARVDSDADAEKFIADFRARRPDNFQKEVADRAANADKYLTIGKTEGSKSLRGKIVILLGPPSRIDVSEETVKNSSKVDNPEVAGLMSNMNSAESGGGKGGGGNNSLGASMSTSTVVRIMHLNYQGEIAKTADRKEIDVDVAIDPVSGKDRIDSHSAESDLNSIFELIAQSWIKK